MIIKKNEGYVSTSKDIQINTVRSKGKERNRYRNVGTYLLWRQAAATASTAATAATATEQQHCCAQTEQDGRFIRTSHIAAAGISLPPPSTDVLLLALFLSPS
jgi:hypothetical protein